MKQMIVILSIAFCCSGFNVLSISHAQQSSRHRQRLWVEAKQLWDGQYSPEELSKWEKRLQKSRAKGKHRMVALCHNAIGVIHYHEGHSEEALAHLYRSIEISRERGLKKMIMNDLFWIGNVHKKQGLLEEALENIKKSMDLARDTGQLGWAGRCLRHIGLVHLKMGHYQASLDSFKEALLLAEERRDERLLMASLNGIGLVYRNEGAHEKAKDCFTRSLRVAEKLGDSKWKVSNLNGLGDSSFLGHDYDGALRHYQQSMALSLATNDRISLAKAYSQIGRIHFATGRKQQALSYLQKSHEISVAMGLVVLQARTSNEIGKVYGRMGKFDAALQKTNEALGILKGIEVPDLLRDCYHMRGTYLEHMGELVGAEKSYKESVQILETLREDLVGGEEEMESFVERRGRVYERLITLLLRQGRTAEALGYLERSRLKKLRDQYDRLNPQLVSADQSRIKARDRELRAKIEQARDQLVLERSKPEADQDLDRILQLEKGLSQQRQEYIENIDELRKKSPDLASLLAIQPDALIDLQRLLPPQVGIIQYLILENRLHIFGVTHDSLSHAEVNVTRRVLEEKIDKFRDILTTPQASLPRGLLEVQPAGQKDARRANSAKTLFEISEELHQLLIRPVQKELSRFQILGIIPNGKLHLLAFQALGSRNESGDFRFLVEDKSIFQLNSQSILKFAQTQARQIGGKSKLIAFGNPDNSLQHAEVEIESIKQVFSEAAVYTRQSASEDRLKSGIVGFDIIHLATHAKMQDNINESYILLARASDGKEDGKLFLREIWGLPLRECQLVTLSACETAKGTETSGDIMMSLETAFLRAGAPTIVASLWQVDDQATGILMETFYRNLMSRGKAAALQEAQMALMHDSRYASPYYWAPFILVGDWR